MSDDNVIPFRPPVFSREAKARWNKIPKSVQGRILENGWCGNCISATTIILESAEMKQNYFHLHGKCKQCGHEVCRVVEPKNE